MPKRERDLNSTFQPPDSTSRTSSDHHHGVLSRSSKVLLINCLEDFEVLIYRSLNKDQKANLDRKIDRLVRILNNELAMKCDDQPLKRLKSNLVEETYELSRRSATTTIKHLMIMRNFFVSKHVITYLDSSLKELINKNNEVKKMISDLKMSKSDDLIDFRRQLPLNEIEPLNRYNPLSNDLVSKGIDCNQSSELISSPDIKTENDSHLKWLVLYESMIENESLDDENILDLIDNCLKSNLYENLFEKYYESNGSSEYESTSSWTNDSNEPNNSNDSSNEISTANEEPDEDKIEYLDNGVNVWKSDKHDKEDIANWLRTNFEEHPDRKKFIRKAELYSNYRAFFHLVKDKLYKDVFAKVLLRCLPNVKPALSGNHKQGNQVPVYRCIVSKNTNN